MSTLKLNISLILYALSQFYLSSLQKNRGHLKAIDKLRSCHVNLTSNREMTDEQMDEVATITAEVNKAKSIT